MRWPMTRYTRLHPEPVGTTTLSELLQPHIDRLNEAALLTRTAPVELERFIRDAHRAGLTQGHIASIVGLTQQRISQIVNDEKGTP